MMESPLTGLGKTREGRYLVWWEIEICMFHLRHEKSEMVFRYLMKL